ncbi:hypothetical protein MRB53_005185 [Persea americana]|uniref:Uncharacterized protein n=1 Tax=Persea americana TaxID=3435 RepID=A0ACC2MCD4_PERAE|nr:hypothetical protein MRB53_005185 [Persea americana]
MESSQSAIAIPVANLSPTTAALSSSDIANILHHLSVVSGNTSTAMFATTGTSTWPFYFAYSNHMTPRSDIFTTTSSAAHVPAIHTADGSRMHAKHIGHRVLLLLLIYPHPGHPTSSCAASSARS